MKRRDRYDTVTSLKGQLQWIIDNAFSCQPKSSGKKVLDHLLIPQVSAAIIVLKCTFQMGSAIFIYFPYNMKLINMSYSTLSLVLFYWKQKRGSLV